MDEAGYRVKEIKVIDSNPDVAVSVCRISPKGLLLIIGISLILILAVPYSGIFSAPHNKDIQIEPPQAAQFSHINGLAKIHSQTLALANKQKQCGTVSLQQRLDCYPQPGADAEKCLQRGCCWKEVNQNESTGKPPSCFYPPGYPSYKMTGQKKTSYGYQVDLRRDRSSAYPMDIMQLRVEVYLETISRVHLKIYDPQDKRYEVPIPTPKPPSQKAIKPDYRVEFTSSPWGVAVIRNDGDVVLFNSSIGPLIFSDQFIQLSSSLASSFIYGLGEHRSKLLLQNDWKTYTIWTQEPEGVRENQNLYGAHPFYLGLEPKTGQAHGVFLLNSNAMDIVLQPTPAITYRTIGGILDYYIFLGPTPSDVIAQYTEVIGRPFMPPYWGLGFHLCRWGYLTANNTWDMVKRMRALGIPQDVQWNDIEYATANKVFTYNNSSFSNLPEFVGDLHKHGQHYIQIVDPGIHNETGYFPFDSGLEPIVFVTDRNDELFIGKVWPGTTVFPDFFDEDAIAWWKENAQAYHSDIPFDGMWIDMNEPSNAFSNGSVEDGCPDERPYDNLPYLPGVYGKSLSRTSFCLSANHHQHGKHFDLHSLYGWSMIKASNLALREVRSNKRPFVITRSTFPSSGVYGGHWLGDNYSEWPDMYFSIPGILAFSMFGIPLVGADICGFNGNTTEPLCQRWTQLGAFYPFSRNHNSWACKPDGIDSPCKSQDPTVFSEAMQNSTRNVLLTRYTLLPYLYTLFYRAHVNGSTVARPLFFEFPKDKATYDVDKQFLWGPALLISPVLEEDTTSVLALFPAGVWYDFYNGKQIKTPQSTEVNLPAPLDHINLHVRGGHILPTQEPNITTTTSRQNSFGLIVALQDGSAAGELFWDDGDSYDSLETGKFTHVTFEAFSGNTITSTVVRKGYYVPSMLLGKVTVYGVYSKPASVTINTKAVTSYQYIKATQVLAINCSFDLPLNQPFTIKWKTAKKDEGHTGQKEGKENGISDETALKEDEMADARLGTALKGDKTAIDRSDGKLINKDQTATNKHMTGTKTVKTPVAKPDMKKNKTMNNNSDGKTLENDATVVSKPTRMKTDKSEDQVKKALEETIQKNILKNQKYGSKKGNKKKQKPKPTT